MVSGWEKAPEYGGDGGSGWIGKVFAVIAIVAIAALMIWPSAAHADPCEAPLPTQAGAEFAGIVTHVIDGDSICVGAPGSEGDAWIEVRIADYDTPEMNTQGSDEAIAIVNRELRGRAIECVVTRGRSGRTRSWDRVFGLCRVGGRPVGEIMRAAGAPQGGN